MHKVVIAVTLLSALSAGINCVHAASTNDKILIAYFSYAENAELPQGIDAMTSASVQYFNGELTGNTGVVARLIQQHTGADLFSIRTENKYPPTYDETLEVGEREHDEDARPEMISKITDLDSYDTVFIGFPNWYYDMPMVMYSFFDEYDFSGKKIIPFNTSGGSRFSSTINTIRQLEPNAVFTEGLSINYSRLDEAPLRVEEFLKTFGY